MKKITFYIVLFSVFCTFSGKAQHASVKQIDSLIAVFAGNVNKISPERSLTINNQIYSDSKAINYKEGIMQGLENLAFCYYVMGNTEKAIPYASLLEKEAQKNSHYKHMAMALRIKAVSYALLGQGEQANMIIDRAFATSDKIASADERHTVKGLLHQARSTMIINIDDKTKYPLLLPYYKSSLKEFLKVTPSHTISNHLADAYSNIAGEYASLRKYDSAQYCFQKALDLSKKTNNATCEYKTLYLIGNSLYEQEKFEEAIIYFLQVKEKATKFKDPYTVKTALEALYYSYKEIKDPKWKEYLVKLDKLRDSISNAEKASLKVPIQQIVDEKEEKFSKERSGLYIIISMVILSLLVVFYFGYRYFKNYRKERIAKLQREAIILEKNSQLAELKLQVDDSFDKVIELAKKDDPLFVTLFKELYPVFYQNLINIQSDLTLSELKVCFYLKLKFSTKEIADYTFVTIKAIQNRKNRLRKRLGIGEDCIYVWMEQLDKN